MEKKTLQLKKNKILFNIIIIFIFFAGIFIDEVLTYDFVSNCKIKQMQEEMIFDDVVNTDTDICTVKLLGTKKQNKVSFYFNEIMQFYIWDYKICYDIIHLEKMPNVYEKYVTDYIHESDGKKRI